MPFQRQVRGSDTALASKEAKTPLVMHDLYPSEEALDEAIASGSPSGADETFSQLGELLAALGESVGRS
jgi:hypothetical protein